MRSLALHGQHLAELYIMPDIMRSSDLVFHKRSH
uniref:Uncharacterized protein n=1 Tax=Anguilla anguilla TaxID=7936 RepID=A0A0E9QKE0_ANGAN